MQAYWSRGRLESNMTDVLIRRPRDKHRQKTVTWRKWKLEWWQLKTKEPKVCLQSPKSRRGKERFSLWPEFRGISDPADTLISDSQPPQLGNINFYCFNHLVCSTWLWQPQKTDTKPYKVSCMSEKQTIFLWKVALSCIILGPTGTES